MVDRPPLFMLVFATALFSAAHTLAGGNPMRTVITGRDKVLNKIGLKQAGASR